MRQLSHRCIFLGAMLLSGQGCGASDEPAADAGPEAFQRPFVRDAEDRALIFHGVNAMGSAKGDPELLPSKLSADVVERMSQDWGFNHARFLMFWAAVEPSPGVFDEGYLDRVGEKLDLFAASGIHVVLDMHQDVYSARFCCDGAPEWAIRDDGEAFKEQSLWALNYLQPAVQRAFDNFWLYDAGEHADLQDHYVAMWRHVAGRFGSHPAVIGYDVMNEPHPGSAFDLIDVIDRNPRPDDAGAKFDREKLQPFYQRVLDGIREADQDGWFFYEARYGGPSNGAASYLPPLDDPRSGGPRVVYYPHLYSFSSEASGEYDRARDLTVPSWEEYRSAEVLELNVPVHIGEWGIVSGAPGVVDYLRDVVEMADRQLAGWAYWNLDPGGYGFSDEDPAGGRWVENEKANWLVRPYPQAVAGEPSAFGFDADTRVFTLEFAERRIAGTTDIYVPASRHYPSGFEVQASDAEGSWSWQPHPSLRDVIQVRCDPAQAKHVITIRPAG